jgi:hypothetical protein
MREKQQPIFTALNSWNDVDQRTWGPGDQTAPRGLDFRCGGGRRSPDADGAGAGRAHSPRATGSCIVARYASAVVAVTPEGPTINGIIKMRRISQKAYHNEEDEPGRATRLIPQPAL